MAAAKHNITIEQGADFEMTITLKDSNGTAIDVSANTISFLSHIKRSPETDPIKDGSNNPIQLVGTKQGGTGVVKFTIAAANTALLPGDNLYYDIFRKNTVGPVFEKDLEGKITVIERVTVMT
tara:strand:+ start:3290 stop:3658 length:369 start_codon:yes stop_codon:yes gene_type:complete